MLFTVIMNLRSNYLLIACSIVLCFGFLLSCSKEKDDGFSARAKIALREAGNQLLISNKDSTSLILPVIASEVSKYRLSFANALSIHPDDLVAAIENSFKKVPLSEAYRVEVIRCEDNEVAYSYEMNVTEEKTIIPCIGRLLPHGCYHVEVQFLDRTTSGTSQNPFLIAFFSLILVGIAIVVYKRQDAIKRKKANDYAIIGSFQFYPDKNKLIKSAKEISLSKKECELLEVLCEHLNDVVKREILEKRVWEDNGVVVGRSLDTYISKLRKKFNEDTSVKITNVHGVGYKLEVFQK